MIIDDQRADEGIEVRGRAALPQREGVGACVAEEAEDVRGVFAAVVEVGPVARLPDEVIEARAAEGEVGARRRPPRRSEST